MPTSPLCRPKRRPRADDRPVTACPPPDSVGRQASREAGGNHIHRTVRHLWFQQTAWPNSDIYLMNKLTLATRWPKLGIHKDFPMMYYTLIEGIPPRGFFRTQVRRRKYKLGSTKHVPEIPGFKQILRLSRVYIYSSALYVIRSRTDT